MRCTNTGRIRGPITVPGTATALAPGESAIVAAVDNTSTYFAHLKGSGYMTFEETADLSVTEFGYLDGITPGTVAANKAVIPTTGGLVNSMDFTEIKKGGVAIEATATEINKLAGLSTTEAELEKLAGLATTTAELGKLNLAPLGVHTIGVGADAGTTIALTIQLKNAAGGDMAERASLYAYLSDDSTGDSIAATAPSGGVAVGADGLAIPVTPALTNALLVDGNLAIDSVAEKFKTGQTSAFLIGGVSHTKAATTALVFTAAHVITALKFGCIRVQINAAGTVSTKVVGTPQAYDDAPTALAALPAADAGNVSLGHIAIENNAGDWTANTDDLTNASDVTTAAFTDSTETPIAGAKAWMLTSESDGDIDLVVTEAGAATWYLVLVLPNGKRIVSGAITFA